jgi:hypothetical protein
MPDISIFNSQVEDYAKKIRELSLTTPSIFLLELHKPLANLFYNLAIFGSPLLSPLFGNKRMKFIETLLSDRQNIEVLIEKLSCSRPSNTEERELVR